MGTRADFYIGLGEKAKWLGSVAWDGYQWDDKKGFLRQAKTEEEFKKAIKRIAKERDDFTKPSQGWPWPWEDSSITDYTYHFTEKGVRVNPKTKFPNMKKKQKVTMGARSGLIVISG